MKCRVRNPGPRVRGSTLVELLVVLAILGVIAAVTGLAFRETPSRRNVDSTVSRMAAARREAIQAGRSVTVTVLREGRALVATAHADGSVIADSSLGIARLSGRVAR